MYNIVQPNKIYKSKKYNFIRILKPTISSWLVALLIFQAIAGVFFLPIKEVNAEAGIVGTSTLPETHQAIRTPLQKKTFYAQERYWAFYSSKNASDKAAIFFSTSIDGENWSSSTEVNTGFRIYAFEFSVWLDDNYVHLVYAPSQISGLLYYKRGTLGSDGTIDWLPSYQILPSTSDTISDPMIATDSNGCPFIVFGKFGTYQKEITILKASTTDGTWGTSTEWTFSISSTMVSQLVPLNNGKMYITYGWTGEKVYGRLYDGTNWSEEEIITDYDQRCSYMSWNTVATGDDVHLVYLAYNNGVLQLRYKERTYGVGWGTEELVYDNTVQNAIPVLSYASSTSDLYCFWTSSPRADHIFYKKYSASSSSWATSPTNWIADDLTGNDIITEQI
jgi:hypothetical protein